MQVLVPQCQVRTRSARPSPVTSTSSSLVSPAQPPISALLFAGPKPLPTDLFTCAYALFPAGRGPFS